MIIVNKNRRLSKNKTTGGFIVFFPFLFLEGVSKNISQSRFRLP